MQKFVGIALGLVIAFALCACRASPVFADSLDDVSISVVSDDDGVATASDTSTDITFTTSSYGWVLGVDPDDISGGSSAITSVVNGLSQCLYRTNVAGASWLGYRVTNAVPLSPGITVGTIDSFDSTATAYVTTLYSSSSSYQPMAADDLADDSSLSMVESVGVLYDCGVFFGVDSSDILYTDVISMDFNYSNIAGYVLYQSSYGSTAYRTALYDTLYDELYLLAIVRYVYNDSSYSAYNLVQLTDNIQSYDSYSGTLSVSIPGGDVYGYALVLFARSSTLDSYNYSLWDTADEFLELTGIDIESYPYFNLAFYHPGTGNSYYLRFDYTSDEDVLSMFDSIINAINNAYSSLSGNMLTYYSSLKSDLSDLSDAVAALSSDDSDSSVDLSTLEEYTAGIYDSLGNLLTYVNTIRTNVINLVSYSSSTVDLLTEISSKIDSIGSYDFDSLLIPDDTVYDDSYSTFSDIVDDHFGFLSSSVDYATDVYSGLLSASADDSFYFPGVSLTLSDSVSFSINSQTVSVGEFIPDDMLVYVRVILTSVFVFAWLNGLIALYHRIFGGGD